MKKKSGRIFSTAALVRLLALAAFAAVCLAVYYFVFLRMPGGSYDGAPPDVAELGGRLRADVEQLADKIGPRSLSDYAGLQRAADFLEASFRAMGYEVSRDEYQAPDGLIDDKAWPGARGQVYSNIVAERKGCEFPGQIVVTGAHYDSVSVSRCRGANDNASGVAGTLALARFFTGEKSKRTLRFVAFVNEEPPFFHTEGMGSLVYARRCKERKENITAMFCLETIGCFFEEEGSQSYPPPLQFVYPSKGNFIAFVGNLSSVGLLRNSVSVFKRSCPLPAEGGAVPGFIMGSNWSDHWSFWKNGYKALMITDTAPFRYPYYHQGNDNADKLNYDKMARLIKGLQAVLKEAAN
jgi:hypothetical protein